MAKKEEEAAATAKKEEEAAATARKEEEAAATAKKEEEAVEMAKWRAKEAEKDEVARRRAMGWRPQGDEEEVEMAKWRAKQAEKEEEERALREAERKEQEDLVDFKNRVLDGLDKPGFETGQAEILNELLQHVKASQVLKKQRNEQRERDERDMRELQNKEVMWRAKNDMSFK